MGIFLWLFYFRINPSLYCKLPRDREIICWLPFYPQKLAKWLAYNRDSNICWINKCMMNNVICKLFLSNWANGNIIYKMRNRKTQFGIFVHFWERGKRKDELFYIQVAGDLHIVDTYLRIRRQKVDVNSGHTDGNWLYTRNAVKQRRFRSKTSEAFKGWTEKEKSRKNTNSSDRKTNIEGSSNQSKRKKGRCGQMRQTQ